MSESIRPKSHAEAVALFRAGVTGELTTRGELADELRKLSKTPFRPFWLDRSSSSDALAHVYGTERPAQDLLGEDDLREALVVRTTRRIKKDGTVPVGGIDGEFEEGYRARQRPRREVLPLTVETMLTEEIMQKLYSLRLAAMAEAWRAQQSDRPSMSSPSMSASGCSSTGNILPVRTGELLAT